MEIKATPARGAVPGGESENSEEKNVFQSVKAIVVGVVDGGAAKNVLVGEDDESV